ncbi:hypothetical protein [Myxococcus phage Mx1]|nr:hypothetical protein [Myxococcus phage Mx1]
MKIGTIENLDASGGLVVFTIKDDDGKTHTLYGDNGQTIRSLDAAYGNVIMPGHQFNADAVKGKRIEYEADDLGLMEYFKPLD